MNFGNGTHGPDIVALASDFAYVESFDIATTVNIFEISAYVDGFGGGGSDMAVRPILFINDDLAATGPEKVIPASQAATWMNFKLDKTVVVPDGSSSSIGLHAGPGDCGRLYGLDDGGGRHWADTYSDGTDTPLPTGTTEKSLSVFASGFEDWTIPAAPEDLLAELPFLTAQQALDTQAEINQRSAVCGWHGLSFDPAEGSFCIVKRDGEFTDLIGERVAVHNGDKRVVAYVHTDGDILEDISLTRRAFMALDVASRTELNVVVGVLH